VLGKDAFTNIPTAFWDRDRINLLYNYGVKRGKEEEAGN